MQPPTTLPPRPTTAEPRARGAGLRLVPLTFASLWARVRRGEGALLAISVTWVVFDQPPGGIAATRIAISTVLLAALYAINDWRDAEDDRRNPKKDQRLVEERIVLRRPLFAWLGALQLGLAAIAFALLGPVAGAATLAMIAINYAYSWWLKGVPVADIATVCAWGGVFVAIVGTPWPICAMVGLMTGIMHVFQIQEDRDVDAANDVRTTVVGSQRAAGRAVALLCAGLFLAQIAPLGALGAATAVTPLLLQRFCARTATAWMLSRVYCGLAVLAALGGMHGLV